MDSMDVNEITKVIDGVYKNITDNFNPASKQMIATGKAYLKSLHGASAACSMYLDALVKLSKQAQQTSVGTNVDIGSSMMQIADVFKEIHTQQLTTLKAFYVDFLVPLETNLEKDVKVIQNEQKKFLVSHKHRVESYNKAVSNAKKVRKKSKKSQNPSSNTLDKEIRIMQNMEEERSKLEAFCEEALREALTQERRRYGFVLERQASLAKHYLAFYTKGGQTLGQKMDQWLKVAKSREALPENVQTNLVKKIQQGEEECIYCSPRRPADDTASITSQLRKTKSMEAGEMLNIQNSTVSNSASSSGAGINYHLTVASSRGVGGGSHHHHHQNFAHHQQLHHQDLPITSAGSLSRAKSDTSLGMINGGGIYGTTTNCGAMALSNSETHQSLILHQGPPIPPPENFRPKSIALNNANAVVNNANCNNEPGHVGYAKALYAYLSNGDNQLCFLENDMIALIGERNRGWQFGENLRTQKLGWFPVAYTEVLEQIQSHGTRAVEQIMMKPATASPVPPPMPPPLPNANHHGIQRTPDTNGGRSGQVGGKGAKANLMIPSGRTSDSLHSSNDSGFSNDVAHHHHQQHHGQVPPPPQPEIDYSDEEPQLSNRYTKESEEIKPGNKWLMDRYHMSETARITHATRRRSLSSGNLSTSDREQQESTNTILRSNNLRNSSYIHNGAGSSPRGQHHIAHATAFYDESGKEGGALKKFLNRTKSLIWRRPSNAGDNYQQNGGDSIRLQRPQQALESISCADTVSELWGSHSSIVEMSEFEMKDLSPPASSSGTMLASSSGRREETAEASTVVDENHEEENDHYANGNIKKSNRGERSHASKSSDHEVPTLPPRNESKQQQQQRQPARPSKMQLSPGSSSTNSNISVPKEADNSCLVVSDHTRPRKVTPPTDYGETTYQTRRGPQKENDIDMIQQEQRQNRGKMSRHHRKQEEEMPSESQNKGISRVESFAVSEAPIIPESLNKFSRRSVANGSVALSNKTTRSRVTTTGKQSSVEELRGRRRLWANHANNEDSYDSDNNNNVNEVEDEDDDEGTIDFNDNEEYDDEATSSVFMEGEHEPEKLVNCPSVTSSGKTLSQRDVKSREPSIPGSTFGTKRSKSSDITTRTFDSRRSRSTSAKAQGMDTVDLPKRHGGFIREKVSRSQVSAQAREMDHATSASTSRTRSHHQNGTSRRSNSSPPRTAPQSKESSLGKEKDRMRTSNGSGKAQAQQQNNSNDKRVPTYKGRPIGSPPPIPAPLPQQQHQQRVQQPSHPPPPPPPHLSHSNNTGPKIEEVDENGGELTEAEPDYGTIKGSPDPPRKDQPQNQQHQIILKQSIVPYTKHQSLIIRDAEARKASPRGGTAWKGSIRSEIHTVELITTTDVRGAAGPSGSDKPVFDYGSFIRKRLYYPERGSRLDQKSERSGNYCGPWYDLWGEDPSVSVG